MTDDRWQVELRIQELTDGISWRLTRPGSNDTESVYSWGSQRTAVARALREREVYEALKATCHELVTQGRLPWLL